MRRAAIVQLAVLAGAVLLGAAAERAAAGDEATDLKTSHYDIHCGIGKERAEEIGRYMEALHAEFTRRLSASSSRSNKRFAVYVYGTHEAFKRAAGPNYENAAGLCDPNSHSLKVRGDLPFAGVLEVLRHEGTHQFVESHIARDCPMWLNEGLAEFFSDSLFVNGRFILGEVPIERAAYLHRVVKDAKFIPLEHVLSITPWEWTRTVAEDPDRARLMYTESWSLVHFLVFADGGKYRKALTGYIDALSQGRDARKSFAAAFGSDLAPFEARWRKFLAEVQPSDRIVCERKLEILGRAVLRAAGQGEWQPTFDEFVADFGRRAGASWAARDPYLGTVSTDDPAAFKAFFACPLTKGAGDAYTFSYGKGGSRGVGEGEPEWIGRLPEIVCRMHPGYVQKLAFRWDAEKRRVTPVIVIEWNGK